jgi:hypothetical protein
MELSEEQIISRLLELENAGEADRRARLVGERYLSLIEDDASGRSYVLRHGVDDTEGGIVPEGTEFWEYDTFDEAERVYGQMLREAQRAGHLVEQDSDDDLGDYETAGAEMRGTTSDTDDPLVVEEP